MQKLLKGGGDVASVSVSWACRWTGMRVRWGVPLNRY